MCAANPCYVGDLGYRRVLARACGPLCLHQVCRWSVYLKLRQPAEYSLQVPGLSLRGLPPLCCGIPRRPLDELGCPVRAAAPPRSEVLHLQKPSLLEVEGCRVCVDGPSCPQLVSSNRQGYGAGWRWTVQEAQSCWCTSARPQHSCSRLLCAVRLFLSCFAVCPKYA